MSNPDIERLRLIVQTADRITSIKTDLDRVAQAFVAGINDSKSAFTLDTIANSLTSIGEAVTGLMVLTAPSPAPKSESQASRGKRKRGQTYPYKGENLTLTQVQQQNPQVNANTIAYRLRAGKSVEEAISVVRLVRGAGHTAQSAEPIGAAEDGDLR